ncbi:MAG: ABC transporter permease [Thermoanaerobaculia bacterium]|nr:ABC transporter permease [Thermoanaerobaculia bacterium]
MPLPNRRYLDLVVYRAYADLRGEAERTYAGYLWWVIDPVVNMAVYYVVFAFFLDRGREDFAPFLLIGLVTWRWFQTAVRIASASILGGAGLMRQVYLPKIVLPTSDVVNLTLRFLFAFALLLPFLWIYGFPVTLSYLALPILMVVELLLILAVVYPLAALVPLLPDLRKVVDNGLTLLFFLSGIFYAGASLPERVRPYFYLNPVVHLIEGYRTVLMEGRWPAPLPLVAVVVGSLIGVAVGSALLSRWDRLYPRLAN